MEDPVADEYLVEMLDAIRENDADDAYDLFVEGYVEWDEMEKTVLPPAFVTPKKYPPHP